MDDALPESDAIDYPTREAWLLGRRLSLGGSDAPTVLRLTPRSPLALFLDKRGRIEPDTVEEPSEAMRWGTLLEPIIRQETALRLGRDVIYAGPYRVQRSRAIPSLTVTLDGILPDLTRGPGILEIKTTYRAAEDGEEAALTYQVQVQHALLVTGCTWGVIAVLYGGQKLVCYPVERSEPALALLRREHAAFWHRVQTDDPPPWDGTRHAAALLRALYPKETSGARVALTAEAVAWDEAYVRLGREITALEREREEAKQHLQAQLGNAEIGVLPDGRGSYSWKEQTRPERVQPAWTGRVFRRSGASVIP